MPDPKPHHLEILLTTAQYLPAEVTSWAYGSRVKGTAYDGSDPDLVLRPSTLEAIFSRVLDAFRAALNESNLPIFVDVHDWAHLPKFFHARILARYEVLREARSAVAA